MFFRDMKFLVVCLISLHAGKFFMFSWHLLIFFSDRSFRDTIRISNSLDPDVLLGLIQFKTGCKGGLYTRYIDAKEPIREKLLFPSPILSRKGAYQLKTTFAIDSDIKRWVK